MTPKEYETKGTQALQTIQHILREKKNPVIFELGMCDGYHTNLLISYCTSPPNYHGFEPDPRNTPRCRAIATRIHFHPCAVGHVTGKVPFYLAATDHNNMAGSSSISPFLEQSIAFPWCKMIGTTEIQCWRLDDFCAQNNIEHIDFLWMDVQGAERLVFDGGERMFPKTHYVYTEYDGGTLYKDSSTASYVKARFQGWETLADTGGELLLKNLAYSVCSTPTKILCKTTSMKT